MASNNTFEVEATVRQSQHIGKGASRRLRRDDKIPGIVYGGGKAPVSLTLEHNKVAISLENEAFYSHVLTLKINSEPERVILKDIQRHPYKPRLLHVDFQRVRSDEKLHMHVPIHFLGGEKAPGAKDAGGLVSHIMSDVEVSCFPDDLPEYIELDISGMQLNQIFHLSDLPLPKGVELVSLLHGNDKPVVSVHMPRIEKEPEPTEIPISAEVPAIEQKAEGEGESESEEKVKKEEKGKKEEK
ncbi:MAG: 50S ribosomal protein L25/general stress protein Ctc [Gammaproteobacteria bacterium RIFCSPHIGHO2_12_FULL_37_34]|nr:MAG: 50S ribosomal protein L25/general stress protein Ctc [Gammaproteobacteria bacterium RIFCSPHIGHO2_12_FULL_37_34]